MSGPILYFFRGLCLSSQPPAVPLLLYRCHGTCSPRRGNAGQRWGGQSATAGPIWSPPAPLPAAPAGGPADVPRAWEWGFRPFQVHGHRRHSAARGAAGSGAFGSILPSPPLFSGGGVLGAYRSPRPFLLLTSAHINKLPPPGECGTICPLNSIHRQTGPIIPPIKAAGVACKGYSYSVKL